MAHANTCQSHDKIRSHIVLKHLVAYITVTITTLLASEILLRQHFVIQKDIFIDKVGPKLSDRETFFSFLSISNPNENIDLICPEMQKFFSHYFDFHKGSFYDAFLLLLSSVLV